MHFCSTSFLGVAISQYKLHCRRFRPTIDRIVKSLLLPKGPKKNCVQLPFRKRPKITILEIFQNYQCLQCYKVIQRFRVTGLLFSDGRKSYIFWTFRWKGSWAQFCFWPLGTFFRYRGRAQFLLRNRHPLIFPKMEKLQSIFYLTESSPRFTKVKKSPI